MFHSASGHRASATERGEKRLASALNKAIAGQAHRATFSASMGMTAQNFYENKALCSVTNVESTEFGPSPSKKHRVGRRSAAAARAGKENQVTLLTIPEAPKGRSITPVTAAANHTILMEQINSRKKRRKSLEVLIGSSEPKRVSIPKDSKGSYGFNLRGSTNVKGSGRQRGQFIRSVDFDGPAHIWGLRAGDRVLAVNGFVCEDQDHETVISFILQTPGRSNLELVVVSDPNMKDTAQTATTGLLKTKAKEVICTKTGIPHYTVEMTEQSLGRTKMLQRKIFGTPGPRAGNYKGGQPQPSHKEVAAMTAGYVMPESLNESGFV